MNDIVAVVRALRADADFAGGSIGDGGWLGAACYLRHTDERKCATRLGRIKWIGDAWQPVAATEINGVAVDVKRIECSGGLNRVAEL